MHWAKFKQSTEDTSFLLWVPMKHSVPQYLNTKKILQTSFFHMSQWEEEVLLPPVLQTGNLGTETLRSKASINFAPSQSYLGPDFLSTKQYMVFNTFKVQLPITTAAAVSTQHMQIRPHGLKSGTETTKSTQISGHMRKVWVRRCSYIQLGTFLLRKEEQVRAVFKCTDCPSLP